MKTSAMLMLLSVSLLASSVAVAENVIESRTIRWQDGDILATARPLIVTASSPPVGGDRVAVPGDVSTSGGVDLSGVGRLLLDVLPAPGADAICSCSLLEGGRFLLTAAHCVTDAAGDLAVLSGANSVTFSTPSGPVTAGFGPSDVSVHPGYTGDLRDGFDVAVIDLGAILPSVVARYDLNDDPFAEILPNLAAGFGRTGDGATGAATLDASLRSGFNNFLSTGLPIAGINNRETQLTADFDSGAAADDAFGVFDEALFGVELVDPLFGGLGFGPNEVGAAPGDSGGPTFVLGPGGPVIAGVHSYGLRLELVGGATSDVDGQLNSTFGEFYVDARIADAGGLGFIRSVAVPEPASLVIALVATLGSGGRRR